MILQVLFERPDATLHQVGTYTTSFDVPLTASDSPNAVASTTICWWQMRFAILCNC
jgi:hypothetical protein